MDAPLPLRTAAWLAARDLSILPPTLFFHARDKLAASLIGGKFRLLSALMTHAEAQGLNIEVVAYAPESHDLRPDPRHLHIFMEDRPQFGAGVFHCVPGYLRGYWYFDELATRNNSTHRLRAFDPRPMSAAFAEKFLAKLRLQFVDANLTKFEQEPRGASIEKGCIAVFAQDFKAPRHHLHHLSVPQMVAAAIAARGGRPVYIKPHPNNTLDEVRALQRHHAPGQGVHVTGASIHDLLAAADCAVTVTSAVGFESFLHQTPVVLCGQTDFHHNAVTLTDPAKMADAMAATMARDWPYAKYVTWFLKQNCIADQSASLPQMLKAIHAKGYQWADAEVRGYY